MPQGSILRPLFFNIFVCMGDDVNIGSYADNTTPYISGTNIKEVIETLENISITMFSWFKFNGIKANSDECHLLLSSDEKCNASFGNHLIESSKQQKLLGVPLDNNLKFEKHINNLCTKASQKLGALCRIYSFMSTGQKRIIMKAFINSQFGYCPLVWMSHNRKINNRINRIHERALRALTMMRMLHLNNYLKKTRLYKIHYRNLQVLATEN